MAPSDDRRAKVRQVLERRGLTREVATEPSERWIQERFEARAQALFSARLIMLTLGLVMLAVPAWGQEYFNFTPTAFVVYFIMLGYSVANFVLISKPVVGRVVTYVTLCLDLTVMVILVVKPGAGLQNPLLATQLVFTTLFALLFPKPLAIVPPLLTLPIITRLDQLLDHSPTEVDILTLFWYLGLNVIVIYTLVYLNHREVTAHREVVELQRDLKELAVVEERNRLAREIHDGLGASLSSLIIQSEYLGHLAKDAKLLNEIKELKTSAEESMEELRRSLQMMREDFDLATGVEDYVKLFKERTQHNVSFERFGIAATRVSPEASLAIFRVLQESLNNALKHASSTSTLVKLDLLSDRISLVVKDNGVGFDTNAPTPGHYGLLNMSERAKSLGASFSIESTVGQGTTVSFSVASSMTGIQ